jgi:hypothetical protein
MYEGGQGGGAPRIWRPRAVPWWPSTQPDPALGLRIASQNSLHY